ncbi:cobW-domain-containing protein [Flagelloscypha sp. PMI_526]|nr:cobW-domain-containing protein [Flagelloscypha sp. PMI_526]
MVDIRPEGSIPITVFTGFLGAGKTSIILSLLPRLPKDYKAVLLKNEFGDVEGMSIMDSKLAEQSSLAGVSEITNGCMCCVMVGRMENALLEIRDQYHPDRIFIECSGSAFPATLAFQLRELERRTSGGLKLDAICTVIDAENFEGYEDTSPTARMQASYSDILIVNKWEDVSERKLDDLYDKLNTLNDGTPKIRSQGKKGVDPSLIFGLESKLFASSTPEEFSAFDHNHEVQTVTLTASSPFTREHLFQGLDRLSKESIWRVKGFVRQPEGVWILNWAFGRHDLTAVGMEASREYLQADVSLKLTVMGEHGEVKRSIRKFAESLSAIVV